MEICKKIHSMLCTGLANRVSLICVDQTPSGQWDLASTGSTSSDSCSLTIGLLVNSEHVNRTVDRGPAVEDKKATKVFRTFWGEKAELRRFKDGHILESLIWAPTSPQHSVLYQIISYLLKRHLHQDIATSLECVGDDFHQEPFLIQDPTDLSPFQGPWEAYEKLQAQIRELNQLPLQVRQISPSCPSLSFTSINSRSPGSSCSAKPMNIIIQFEGSARWPDDIKAIQKTKLAFLLKIGELLEEADSSNRTFLGFENEGQPLLNAGFLDILASFFSFRVRIYHDRELTLLESQLKSSTLTAQAKDDTVAAISIHKRMYIHSPTHTQTIRSLCTIFPLLSATTRLLKHWFSSHLLLPHFSEELLEVLAARTFLLPYPFDAPGSLRSGFLRTLAMIARWDWHNEPLFVDFRREMVGTEAEIIHMQFNAWRKLDPTMNRMTLYISSNLDPEGIAWVSPRKVVAGRMTALAQAAYTEIKAQGRCLTINTLFASPMTDYDFIIYINRKYCDDTELDDIQAVYKKLHRDGEIKERSFQVALLISFIGEVERLYGHSLVLFHDSSIQALIAGIWNPSTNSRDWKVNLAHSTTPAAAARHTGDRSVSITINRTAVLNEIARLGGPLISRIVIKNESS